MKPDAVYSQLYELLNGQGFKFDDSRPYILEFNRKKTLNSFTWPENIMKKAQRIAEIMVEIKQVLSKGINS